MACCIASAHPYQRWDNPTTRTLQAEASILQSADCPEKNLRIAVGDNTENAVYWSGEKPLPAARTADLLQLSMEAGSCGADDWFTNKDGDLLVFVARPGVGSKHYVFTVFTLRDDEWHKTGTYHFISRHLRICWEEVSLAHRGLSIVATSPQRSLRVEKRFDFAETHDTFCAYDAPDEAPDMGLDLPVSPSTPQQASKNAERFRHYSTSGYPRYSNEVTRALEADAALSNGPISPVLGRLAFIGVNPENVACWNGEKPLPASRVANLLQVSLHRGYTTGADWFTNASGSVIAFLAQPGNGAGTDVFTVFRRTGSEYRRVGVYTFTRRVMNLRPEEIELTEESLTLTYATPRNNTRFTKTFSFCTAEDSCCAFEDITERNDCGKDTRPNRPIGIPELINSPARERLQPLNARTRHLRRAEQEICYNPEPRSGEDKWQNVPPLELMYTTKLRYGGVEDWISDEKSNTIAFISRSNVKHEVVSTYTFQVYRCRDTENGLSWSLIGTYKLNFSPYELSWDPAETYFRHEGLHVRCRDLNNTRHTGVIFHFSSNKENVHLN